MKFNTRDQFLNYLYDNTNNNLLTGHSALIIYRIFGFSNEEDIQISFINEDLENNFHRIENLKIQNPEDALLYYIFNESNLNIRKESDQDLLSGYLLLYFFKVKDFSNLKIKLEKYKENCIFYKFIIEQMEDILAKYK